MQHMDFWPYVWRTLGEHGARLSNIEKCLDSTDAKLDKVAKDVASILTWVKAVTFIVGVVWVVFQFIVPHFWK